MCFFARLFGCVDVQLFRSYAPPSNKPTKQSYWFYVYILCLCYAYSMFTEQLNDLPGSVCLIGDMNICFDSSLESQTKQTLTTLCLHSLVQVINKPAHKCGHIIDWVIVRPDDDIHKKYTVTDSLESDRYCTKSYFNVTVSMPST